MQDQIYAIVVHENSQNGSYNQVRLCREQELAQSMIDELNSTELNIIDPIVHPGAEKRKTDMTKRKGVGMASSQGRIIDDA
jgi:hypothetical protein